VFNLSGSEIVFLLLAGLVVLGPERLPGVIRTVGKIYGDFRRMARGLERELTDTFREPIEDFKSMQKDLSVGFGKVDTEPSPPMRPEQARAPQDSEPSRSDSDSSNEESSPEQMDGSTRQSLDET
jgi:sec-independent protein translocase protein TatB